MKFQTTTNSKRQIEINWKLVNAYLAKWKPGTVLDIKIVRHVKRKSDAQRATYFAGMLKPFAKGLGYEPQEYEKFHDQLKIVYFGVKPDKKGIYRDKDIPHVFSKESDLNVSERKEFMEWVLRKAAQEGVYIEI